MPAEAVPLLGITVIVGATAGERPDACALMQDVHELDVAFDPSLANDPTRREARAHAVPSAAEVWQRIATDPAALDAHPDEYGPLPELTEPGWRVRALSWFADAPAPLAPEDPPEINRD